MLHGQPKRRKNTDCRLGQCDIQYDIHVKSLTQFSDEQVTFVRTSAAKLRRLWELRPELDCEGHAERLIKTVPILKGVSVTEFLREVLDPGTFSNH